MRTPGMLSAERGGARSILHVGKKETLRKRAGERNGLGATL